MCSNYITLQQCLLITNKVTTSNHSALFTSLDLLCKSKICPASSIENIVDQFPHILPTFLTQTLGESLLKHAKHGVHYLARSLKLMENAKKRKERKKDDEDLYRSVLCGVMCSVSEDFTPQQLLSLLPHNASLALFSSFIQRTCMKQLARDLCKAIIQKYS